MGYLDKVVVAETSDVISIHAVFDRVYQLWPSTVKVFNMVPTKYLIVLESVGEIAEVLKENCPLLEIFQAIRNWDEMEDISQRTVWLECNGFPPCLWSKDNIRKVGEI